MSTAVAKTNTDVAKVASGLQAFNVANPQSMLDSAKELKNFIVANKLSNNIGGKEYANVEAWQFLFALAGYDVIVDQPQILKRGEGIIAYTCGASLFDRDGKLVGRGFAECDSAEKRGYKEFAIMSFAQTRAIGKAGRNKFAFILKAAGYEPTPAEEMTDVASKQDAGTGASLIEDDDVPTIPVPTAQAGPAPIQPIAETVVESKPAAQAPKPTSGQPKKGQKAPAPAEVPAPSGDDDDELPTPIAPAPVVEEAPKAQFTDVVQGKMLEAIDQHGLTAVAGIRERIGNYAISAEQKANLVQLIAKKGYDLEKGTSLKAA